MIIQELQELLPQALVPVQVAKLLKTYGEEAAFQAVCRICSVDSNDEYAASIEALEHIYDFVERDYDEANDIEMMYFSDQTIMEYYRLCREDARLRKIPFEKSPLVRKAADHVREWLYEAECYYCGYELRIDPEKQWGCGIFFECFTEMFWEYYPLLRRLLNALAFFKAELPALRREVDALKRPFAIVPYTPKGAAI